ncbi:MAG TPA: hypothetical protein VK578_16245 [Edaphobacter sp.]|jgi:hypothetical protein|nr:hypothetical protein [Edaphobacter sp.]
MSIWFRFVISAFAVWRLTHLLAAEDGPWNLMVRIRQKLGLGIWGKLMDCFNCLSIWISIPFAFYVASGILNILIVWFALSGIASLANRLGQEPIVFQSLEPNQK